LGLVQHVVHDLEGQTDGVPVVVNACQIGLSAATPPQAAPICTLARNKAPVLR